MCVPVRRSGSGRMVVPHWGAVAPGQGTTLGSTSSLHVPDDTSVAGGLPCSPQAQPSLPTCGHGSSHCGSAASGLGGCESSTAPC